MSGNGLKIVRTPAEQSQYIEARLYELQLQDLNIDAQRREFERVMDAADVTDVSLKRELWLILRARGYERPRIL
jgi:hypothetical protein